jgi:hypothetical protein
VGRGSSKAAEKVCVMAWAGANRRTSALLSAPIHQSAEKDDSWKLGGLEEHKRGSRLRLLPRSLAFLVEQPDLHHLLAILHSLLFGKIEVPQNVEHAFVPGLYERVK